MTTDQTIETTEDLWVNQSHMKTAQEECFCSMNGSQNNFHKFCGSNFIENEESVGDYCISRSNELETH